MLIYDTKLKSMREMTAEEEYTANNMPDPEEARELTPEEIAQALAEVLS